MSKVGYGICFLLMYFLVMRYSEFGVLIDIVLIILILFYLQALQIVDDGTEASIAADNSLYIAVMFEVAGQVCAAKGHVSDEDRSRVYDMIKKMQLDAETEVLSRNMGQTKNYPLRTRLKQLYRTYRDDKRGLMLFCKNMLELALIDGRLHNNERRILNIIADEFHIPYAQMLIFASQTIHQENEYRHYWQTNEQWKQQRQRARSEQRRQQYQQQQKKQYQQQYQQHHNQQQQPEEPFGSDPYLVLGISAKASPQEIKQAYRRLMNKYHPDKLIKQNLSKTKMQQATEHAQRIQAAYAYVKQLRGFV